MTKLDTTTANREFDIWLVEHGLGWKRHDKCDQCLISPRHLVFHGLYVGDDWEGKECHPYLERPDGERYWLCPCQERKGTIEIPPLSSDIAAACGPLLDKLRERYHVRIIMRSPPSRDVAVYLDSPGDGFCEGAGYADALPLAICQAAYAAFGTS